MAAEPVTTVDDPWSQDTVAKKLTQARAALSWISGYANSLKRSPEMTDEEDLGNIISVAMTALKDTSP